MIYLPRVGALDIAAAIAERIGSYVDMDSIQFLAVEGDRVRCWYVSSGGRGPAFEISLQRSVTGWLMKLTEQLPESEQQVEVP